MLLASLTPTPLPAAGEGHRILPQLRSRDNMPGAGSSPLPRLGEGCHGSGGVRGCANEHMPVANHHAIINYDLGFETKDSATCQTPSHQISRRSKRVCAAR